MTENLSWWQGKRVLITGNDGFKGSWLSVWLSMLGADIVGLSDGQGRQHSLSYEASTSSIREQILCDIADIEKVRETLRKKTFDVIFHLAAQSLVSLSLSDPGATFKTNVLGATSLFEAIRQSRFEGALVFVTSDKCYLNDGRATSYHEEDRLGGEDPYSASKACAEIIYRMYVSILQKEESQVKLASARAGNVFGGGDWNPNRLIVDAVKSWTSGQKLSIRNPISTRPWQFVLDPLFGYLELARKLSNKEVESGQSFNFGPDDGGIFNVMEIVESLSNSWGKELAQWEINSTIREDLLRHETLLLSLDSKKSFNMLGWKTRVPVIEGLKLTVDWYKKYNGESSALQLHQNQINYFSTNYISCELKESP